MKDQISISEFKAKCLAEVSRVARISRALVITRHGKPIARIVWVDVNAERPNPLKDSVGYEGDLISPIDEDWNAA